MKPSTFFTLMALLMAFGLSSLVWMPHSTPESRRADRLRECKRYDVHLELLPTRGLFHTPPRECDNPRNFVEYGVYIQYGWEMAGMWRPW